MPMTSSQEIALHMVSKFARYDIPVFRGASSAAQLFAISPASNALSGLIIESVLFFIFQCLTINGIAKDIPLSD